MFGWMRAVLTIAVLATALPADAQAPAPTTTAFDGTYIGVSRTLETTMAGHATRQCPPSGRVPPLTIVNGIARTAGLGTAEGSVSPEGAVVMRALAGFGAGSRFEGRIDDHGTVTGRFTAPCSYQVVWQKKSS